jgi:hypothetical protein
MSDKVDDGGPAFPRPTSTDEASERCNVFYAQDGMTLRDWFAGQALSNAYTQADVDPDRIARWSYELADAMLAARKGARDE